MYNAIEIAKYLINLKFTEGSPINNNRVQMLLYLVQGQSYRLYGIPVFKEIFYAWKQGPVIPDVYWTYSGYLNTNIRCRYEIKLDNITTELLNDLLTRLDNFDNNTLQQIVCEKDSPWDKYYNEKQLTIIPEKQIKKYFLSF